MMPTGSTLRQFPRGDNNYLSYGKIDNALLVTGPRPTQLACRPALRAWNIFADGGVTQAAQYLYLLGTSSGDNSLAHLHADITASLGKYVSKLPTARDGSASTSA